MNYIIVDDEHMAHNIIKGHCDMFPHLHLVSHCFDAIEAIECLNKHNVDLIFLDLNMPKLKGFDFLRSLTNPPQVIVTSAYQEYALEGYELQVVDYLLKPIGFERFVKAINKLSPRSITPRNVYKPEVKESIFFQSNKKHIQVRLGEILFVEAMGNYCKVVTLSEEIRIREKISELSKTLPDALFVQVHKSFLVARNHINKIEGNSIFILNYSIPVGKYYKANVKSLLKQ